VLIINTVSLEKRKKKIRRNTMKTISVIITTKNDYDNLDKCLHALVYEKPIIKEVIVVDGDGDDTIKRRCSIYPGYYKYINGKGTNMCEGRNLGIKNATGTILAFIDSDTIVHIGWASELQKAMRGNSIVAGYTEDGKGGHRMNRVMCFVNGNDITYAACNIAYHRRVVQKVGYFDTKLKSADDLDYNLRCVLNGFSITYAADMTLTHFHRQSKIKWMKQQFWYGYGRYQFNKKYPGLKHEVGSIVNLVRLSFGALGYVFGKYLIKK
jgi:glycosyltransferase involved in cell wall biosynthesis